MRCLLTLLARSSGDHPRDPPEKQEFLLFISGVQERPHSLVHRRPERYNNSRKCVFKFISHSGHYAWLHDGCSSIRSTFTLNAAVNQKIEMSRDAEEGVLCDPNVRILASTWGPSATVHPGIINSIKRHTFIVP